jgi:hypothetical protein
MRRLAIFWLLCAAAGFVVAVVVALALGLAVDNRETLRRSAAAAESRILDQVRRGPTAGLSLPIPRFSGGSLQPLWADRP